MEPCSLLIGAGVVGALFFLKRAARFRFGHHRYAFAGCGGHAAPWDDHGFGHGHGHHRHGSHGWRGRRGGGFVVRGILTRLGATPAQEKEIRDALAELWSALGAAKEDLEASRSNLAHAIASDTFDEIAMGEANVSFDKSTAKAKEAIEAALRRVHAVLDATQRERLAELIEEGALSRRWGGPYRS